MVLPYDLSAKSPSIEFDKQKEIPMRDFENNQLGIFHGYSGNLQMYCNLVLDFFPVNNFAYRMFHLTGMVISRHAQFFCILNKTLIIKY